MVEESGQPAEEFKSSWNNASGLTIQIDQALTSANEFFMESKLGAAFKSLCAVVMRFCQHLTPEEEAQLNKKERPDVLSSIRYVWNRISQEKWLWMHRYLLKKVIGNSITAL
jgi:hypothetical protein